MIYTKEFIRKLAIKNGILTGVSPIINDFIEFPVNCVFRDSCTTVKHVEIPDEVKEIDDNTFSSLHIFKIVFPDGIEKINENAFYKSRLDDVYGAKEFFSKQDKSWFLKGFGAPVSMYFNGIIDKDSVAWSYFADTIKRKKRDIFSDILWKNELEKLKMFLDVWKKVPDDDIDEYLKLCAERKNSEAAAVILEYKQKQLSAPKSSKNTKSADSELELREPTLADWRKIFRISTVDGCATISGYKGSDANITIPEKVGDYKVTAIGKKAFEFDEEIKSIIIPESVTEIGKDAFCNSSLEEIKLPSTIRKIDEGAFACTYISEITIPEGVREISVSLFEECENLKSVSLPEGITRINKNAFWGCSALNEIRLPLTVTDIEEYAFTECKELKAIYIPKNAVLRSVLMFDGCDGITVYSAKGSDAEEFCKEVRLPFVVDESMNQDPISVEEEIVEKEKDFKTETPMTVAQWRKIYKVAVFDKKAKLGKYVGKDKEIEIPSIVGDNKVEAIDELTFCKNKNITKVVIPEGVTLIMRKAFCDCSSLVEIVIPDSIREISYEAFKNCTSLETLKLKKCVLERDTFKGCKNLKSLTTNEASLEWQCFDDCKSLTDLHVEPGAEIFYWGRFNGFPALKNIYLPDSIKEFRMPIPKGRNNLTIHAAAGSYAEQYAKENHIPFVAEE